MIHCSSVSIAQQKDSLLKVPGSQLDSSVLTKVEVEASFPGGENAWNEYIRIPIENSIKKLCEVTRA